MIYKYVLFLLFGIFYFSNDAVSDDITCPVGFPKSINSDNTILKKRSISSKQEIVELVFNNKHEGKKISSAKLVVGEWDYNREGELVSSVDIEVDLKMESEFRQSTVKFIKSKLAKKIRVIIYYGELCGYTMEIKIS